MVRSSGVIRGFTSRMALCMWSDRFMQLACSFHAVVIIIVLRPSSVMDGFCSSGVIRGVPSRTLNGDPERITEFIGWLTLLLTNSHYTSMCVQNGIQDEAHALQTFEVVRIESPCVVHVFGYFEAMVLCHTKQHLKSHAHVRFSQKTNILL